VLIRKTLFSVVDLVTLLLKVQGAKEDVWSKLFKICPDLPELSKIEWKVKKIWNA
jgi:hypothetical protein